MKNRAIDKYRVWDEEMKEYVSSRVFINHHGEVCLIKNGCFYQNKTTKEHCTGLKDKNGKLIFEGDVVRCDIDFVPDGRVGLVRTVIFKDGAFQLSCKDGFYFIMGFHNFEIIGNIHKMEVEK